MHGTRRVKKVLIKYGFNCDKFSHFHSINNGKIHGNNNGNKKMENTQQGTRKNEQNFIENRIEFYHKLN